MQLNKAQQQAVSEFDRDLLVLAGAGTGKTRVLTEKYLSLIEQERLDPRRIVAITFTQKAALEMRSRIGEAIEARRDQADGSRADFWRRMRVAMDEAYIGTFHGFCGNIVREFPLVTGVFPGVRVLSEGECRILLADSAEKACIFSSHDNESDRQEEFYQAILNFGLPFFLEQLRDLFPKIRESALPISAWFPFQEPTTASYKKAVDELRHSLDEILESEQRKEANARSRALLDEVESDLHELQPTADGIFSDCVQRLNRLKGLFPKNQSKALRPFIDQVHQAIEAVISARSHLEYLHWARNIRRFLELLDVYYAKEKSAQNAMDFADLQIKARDLLRDQLQVRESLQKRFDYFMVDEFQDTNLLQLEIVRYLVGEGHDRGRLFVVGDAKQSIYRFRGAQVEVVRNLEEELTGRQGTVLPLVENYRCHPAVIDLINLISEKIFATENMTYHPLVAGRSDDSQTVSRVHLIVSGEEDDRSADAEKLATHLQNLVRGESLFLETGGQSRPIRYADMAILFRAMTHVNEYTAAFEKMGIPYLLGAGSGYYGVQEVQDQLNLIRLVQNSQDSLALLALLRSPYVGLSDIELYWMARSGSDLLTEFYQSKTPPKDCGTEVWDRILRFRIFIRQFQAKRAQITVSEIIREALNELGYKQVLAAFPGSSRKLANLDKLLHKADAFAEVAGRYSIGQFLEYIGNLVAYQEKEGEANVEGEGSDAVRILTIHASKGLEFPLVVLPELAQKLNRSERSSIIHHPNLGVAFKVPDGTGSFQEPPLRKAIKELNGVEELSELKRLLYVALTRARDYLVLSGIRKSDAEEGKVQTWADWIQNVIPSNALEEDTFTLAGRTITVIDQLSLNQKATPVEFFELPTDLTRQEIASVVEENLVGTGMKQSMKRQRIAVTSLMAYLECPRQYYLHYRLGLDAPQSSTGGGNPEGALLGRIVHSLCALENLNTEIVDEKIKQGLSGILPERRQQTEAIVRRLWESYLQSPYPNIGGRVYSEFPFALLLGSYHRLHGIIDRMIRTEQGIILVDFKTDRIKNEDDLDRLVKHYRPQLLTYAFAVQSIFGELPQTELYFLDARVKRPIEIDQETVEKWSTHLTQAADAIHDGNGLSDFIPVRDCDTCARKLQCPTFDQVPAS